MQGDSPARIHVLTGPTAVGKTELALRWAEENDAEIVSCDSLLFYRGMDIGTAKPTPLELARIPHHLVDICGVTERMDVVKYVDLAREAVTDCHARGKQVLVTGGSGFYLKAFFAPISDGVLVPEILRAEVALQLEHEGLPAVLARLRQLNPGGIGELDTANPRRVTRALERCLASGRTLRELSVAFARLPGPFSNYDVRLCRLERAPEELRRRIAVRVDAMLHSGLIAEVSRLREAGLTQNPSAASAIGYRETLAMLAGQLDRESLGPSIVQNTVALVKKQRTWFRTQLPSHREVHATAAEVSSLF